VIEIEGDKDARDIVRAENERWQDHEDRLEILRAQAALLKAGDDKGAYELAVAQLKDAATAAFEDMSRVRHETAVAKVPYVIDFIKGQLEDNDNKIVVFAHHRDVVQALMNGLAEFGTVQLVGGMSSELKDVSVRAFQNNPHCRIFVGNIQAAGVGITLTAASHVIFAELDWVPANITQAEDRCHRIGQHDSVLVQHLVLEGSLDARMAQKLVQKQRVADAALDTQKGYKIEDAKTTVTIHEDEDVVTVIKDGKDVPVATKTQIQAAHRAVQILASRCDGAHERDGAGFNSRDTAFGKLLAALDSLSPKQGAIAIKFARLYQGQLPTELIKAAGIEPKGKTK
jgi:SNF2 family DNA or RNA helicase